MAETRTPKQIAADKVDLKLYNAALALGAFGIEYDDRALREASQIVSSLRSRVRAHMHPRDREETGQ